MKKGMIAIALLGLLAGGCHTKPSSTSEQKESRVDTQSQSRGSDCDHFFSEDHERVTGETSLTVNEKWETIKVDAYLNGGIDIEGYDGEAIQILAKMSAWGKDKEEANQLLSEVNITAKDGVIRADGPKPRGNKGFSVSFEIKVPKKSNLELKALNGGIAIANVDGNINATGVNGGLKLRGLSGDVNAKAVNGSVSISLLGDRWVGAGLEARTTNGSVKVEVPKNYSAELELKTVNGSIKLDFPVTVQGKIGKEIKATLGSGGPGLSLSTVNGAVKLIES